LAKELSTGEVFSIIDQLKGMGCFYLGFTGGEPFLREDIFQILWYAKKRGFQIIIYTNASLLDREKIRELRRIRPNKIDITLLGVRNDTVTRITGVVGAYVKIMEVIELLYDAGLNVGFKTSILKDNAGEVKAIRDFSNRLGIFLRVDSKLFPRWDGAHIPFRERGIKGVRSLFRLQTKPFADLASNPSSHNVKESSLFSCGVGVSQAAITPQGELKMCVMINYPLFSVVNGSLRHSWAKLVRLVRVKARRKRVNCHTCNLEGYCLWCPAYGWIEKKDFSFCDQETKRHAACLKQLCESDAVKDTCSL